MLNTHQKYSPEVFVCGKIKFIMQHIYTSPELGTFLFGTYIILYISCSEREITGGVGKHINVSYYVEK